MKIVRTLAVAAALACTAAAAAPAQACGSYGMTPRDEARAAVVRAFYQKVEEVDVELSSSTRGTAVVKLEGRKRPIHLRLVKRQGRWAVFAS